MSSDEILYIFVDESGVPNQTDIYTIAGAWTLSNESQFSQVVKPTVMRLESMLKGRPETPGKELKGSKLSEGSLDVLLSNLVDAGISDGTVIHSGSPWPADHPFRFSLHDVNRDLADDILSDILGSPLQVPVTLQTLALASILNPLLRPDAVDGERVDRVVVILDSDTWEQASQKIKQGLQLLEDQLPTSLEFNTRDSQKTPGIQIADLAAYCWRSNLRKGECATAVRAIHELRFKGRI